MAFLRGTDDYLPHVCWKWRWGSKEKKLVIPINFEFIVFLFLRNWDLFYFCENTLIEMKSFFKNGNALYTTKWKVLNIK